MNKSIIDYTDEQLRARVLVSPEQEFAMESFMGITREEALDELLWRTSERAYENNRTLF